MAAGQKQRSDAGTIRLDPDEAEQILRERPGTREICCGMLVRAIDLIEKGRWEDAETLLGTAQRFVETVTDPLGDRGKIRAKRKGT